MGAKVKFVNKHLLSGEPVADILVEKSKLKARNFSKKDIPSMIDEIPLLALIATQAEGVTKIAGAQELRVKESDRIRATYEGLRKMGAKIEELKDGFIIKGPQKLKGTSVRGFSDHRIVMMLYIAGLIAEGRTTIDDISSVKISFPDFFGPAGAGKSTIAKLVARKLQFTYIDTGAMYRAITYKVLKNNCSLTDKERIIELAKGTKIEFKEGKIFLDGEDVSQNIRTRKVTNNTSVIAAIPEVREILRNIQREYARDNNIVMEGRDIGTVVFPEAQHKFYLDASLTERAKRRFLELKNKGVKTTLDEIAAEISERDNIDLNRGLCPLKVPEGATVIDSTNKTIDEVVELIVKKIKK